MKEQCVPLYIAQRLKKLGFKELCLFGYDKCDMFFKDLRDQQEFSGVNYNASGYCCSAPFWQQVFDWFRMEHKIEVGVVTTFYEGPSYNAYAGSYIVTLHYNKYVSYGSYEIAQQEAINAAMDKVEGVEKEIKYKSSVTY